MHGMGSEPRAEWEFLRCVWCALSVSPSEAANNEAWLAWESWRGPPINLRDGGGGRGRVLSHTSHCHLLSPKGTAQRSRKGVDWVQSCQSVLSSCPQLKLLTLKYDDLNFILAHYLIEKGVRQHFALWTFPFGPRNCTVCLSPPPSAPPFWLSPSLQLGGARSRGLSGKGPQLAALSLPLAWETNPLK